MKKRMIGACLLALSMSQTSAQWSNSWSVQLVKKACVIGMVAVANVAGVPTETTPVVLNGNTPVPSTAPQSTPVAVVVDPVAQKEAPVHLGVAYTHVLTADELAIFHQVFGSTFDPTKCTADGNGFCVFGSTCLVSKMPLMTEEQAIAASAPATTPAATTPASPSAASEPSYKLFSAPECHAQTEAKEADVACKDNLIANMKRLPKTSIAAFVGSVNGVMITATKDAKLSLEYCRDAVKSGASMVSSNWLLVATTAGSAIMLHYLG